MTEIRLTKEQKKQIARLEAATGGRGIPLCPALLVLEFGESGRSRTVLSFCKNSGGDHCFR